jgi:hypothetical protein
MDLSAFVIRVAFLALPGLLASALYRKARGRRDKKHWEDFFEVMIFSLTSYLLLALIINSHNLIIKNRMANANIVGTKFPDVNVYRTAVPPDNTKCLASTKQLWAEPTFFKTVTDENAALNWLEIGWACLIGVALAVIASYFHKYKIITLLFRTIRASNKVADEDIWELFHDSKATADWLFVRDHKLHLVYFGYISYYSDSGKDRELAIDNASVYYETGELLYECPGLYICRDKFDLTIELRDNTQVNRPVTLKDINDEKGISNLSKEK